MCGICGSYNLDSFREFVKLNLERGNFSHSYTVYDCINKCVVQQLKSFIENAIGNLDRLVTGSDLYYLGHTQAPTGGLIKDFWRIHPSMINYQLGAPTLLAHNGILIDQDLGGVGCWDTHVLHNRIRSLGLVKALSQTAGSFACWYINEFNQIQIFRNPQAPLYCAGSDFSSTVLPEYTQDFNMIESGVVYQLDDLRFRPTPHKFKVDTIWG